MNDSALNEKEGEISPQVQSAWEFLLAQRKISAADLERALEINNGDLTKLGPLLVRLGFVSEEDLLDCYLALSGLPALRIEDIPQVPLEDCALSTKFLKESYAVPIEFSDESLVVAIANPEDKFACKAIAMATGRTIDLRLASVSLVEKTIEQLYGMGQSQMSNIVDEIAFEQPDEDESIERLKDLAAEAPIIRLVSMVINRAVELRASDIHIEPFENQLKIRYRIDGVLQEVEAPPAHSTAAVISRIKIMAKLNIAERRLPQDGRIQLRTQGKLVDLRVSTVPTLHGESMVLRVLDKQLLALELDVLGFEEPLRQQFQTCLAMPHGIILVTGPTGSGKTTTLYAALQTLNTPEKKILTVEDPVEYQIDGINQIQVKQQIGLDFADALRSIVRQDPDIIMIGEMRDMDTARIAVQSALTGHLVFSTLHTNDAGSSITRLLDMGIEDYLITSTLNAVLAQRLARTICGHCKEILSSPPLSSGEPCLDNLAKGSPTQFVRATGCEECASTGYRGRTIIAELLVMSETIRREIHSHADGTRLQRSAIDEGMVSMKSYGLLKAARGLTTLEEINRVIQA